MAVVAVTPLSQRRGEEYHLRAPYRIANARGGNRDRGRPRERGKVGPGEHRFPPVARVGWIEMEDPTPGRRSASSRAALRMILSRARFR